MAAALAALLLAACGGDGDPGPDSGSDPPPATTTPVVAAATEQAGGAGGAPADAAPSVVQPEAGVLPRSVSYGMLLWTLEDAAITNQEPRTYVAGETGRASAKTYLILDFEQRNENVTVGVAPSPARMQLLLADGTVVEAADARQEGVPPASAAGGRYAFEVPDGATFDGLSIAIVDPGREPSVTLPLSGDAPEVEATDVREVQLGTAVPLPGIEMDWGVHTLTLGHDWPLPLGHRGGARIPSLRSEAGMLWLGVVAEVNVGACDCRGGVLDQASSVRLIVEGQPLTPEARDSSMEIMGPQTVSEVMFVFAIPAETDTATLQIGPLDEPGQQATVELRLD